MPKITELRVYAGMFVLFVLLGLAFLLAPLTPTVGAPGYSPSEVDSAAALDAHEKVLTDEGYVMDLAVERKTDHGVTSQEYTVTRSPDGQMEVLLSTSNRTESVEMYADYDGALHTSAGDTHDRVDVFGVEDIRSVFATAEVELQETVTRDGLQHYEYTTGTGGSFVVDERGVIREMDVTVIHEDGSTLSVTLNVRSVGGGNVVPPEWFGGGEDADPFADDEEDADWEDEENPEENEER